MAESLSVTTGMNRLALSVNEVAEKLGLHRNTVYGLINAGELKAKTVGKRRKIVFLEWIEEWANKRDA